MDVRVCAQLWIWGILISNIYRFITRSLSYRSQHSEATVARTFITNLSRSLLGISHYTQTKTPANLHLH